MKLQLIILALLLAATSAQSQVFISSGHNNGSQAYDYSNAETVTNDAEGVGYIANASSEFYHYGPASGTITVNGLYNAFDPAVTGFTATPATPGVDYFRGLDGLQSSAQEIAGNTAPRFGILKLDNGANEINITNTNGAEVGLRTDFTNGITTTVRANSNTGALRFFDNATYTNSALGNAQYVNGYVGKIGNDAFTFPVGNQAGNNLRTLAISAPTMATDHLSIAYWSGDPSAGIDPTGGAHATASINTVPLNGEVLVSVSPIGFWDWIPVAGASSLNVTVSLPNNLVPSGYTNAANIRLVGWNTSTSQWELLGNTPASSTAEGATLSGNTGTYGGTMATYSAIGWGSISQQPLPLGLISFTAQSRKCLVDLLWQVENVGGIFSIERSSDSKRWQEVDNMQTGISTSKYIWTDLTPMLGVNYYRLKLKNEAGKFDCSAIVSVTNKCGVNKITVSPNPASEFFTVNELNGNCQLYLYNVTGQLLYSGENNGCSTFSIPIIKWPNGIYVLNIMKDGQSVYSKQLTKQ